jgi:exodeoxyribonuclease V beta subunit
VTDTTFSLTGPLPTGTTLLEASAGTGKTYTIAGLVLRYVAEAGVPLARILVVTFTRAATAELRDRVRRRMVEATEHLRAVLDGADPAATDDDVLGLLASAGRDEVRERLVRVERALGDFDAATVATIHGFCQQVLAGLGVAADVPRGAELVTETADLVDEVVTDLLVDRYADRPGGIPFSSVFKTLEISRAVLGNPAATIVPQGHADEVVAERVAYAHALRAEAAARKSAAGVLAFDDLLTRLADSLDDPVRGPAARAALRRRYHVALVDEFQDTDPIQWRIVHGAFHDRPGDAARDTAGEASADDATTRALVLIGDPKQAIYAFRGADIHAYLAAVDAAGTRTTLGTNYRSDGPLLGALDWLYRGARFGDRRIVLTPVRPAPGAEAARIVDPSGDPPLVVRRVPLDAPLPKDTGGKRLKVGAVREHIARDVAAEVLRMLDPQRPVELLRDGERRRLRTSDVAVLVRTNAEARLVQASLLDVGVPAIVNGVGSVFSSDAAVHWRTLLLALERPSDPGRARAAAVGPLVGWTAERVVEADDDALDRLHGQLHRWARVLSEHGVAALLSHLEVATRVHARLLTDPAGQRLVTDLEHLGELLHTAATAEHLGVGSLRAWLDERIAEADDEVIAPEERARRLESDAAAVQILTVHRSKGLEFPVVLAPYLWNCNLRANYAPSYHDDDLDRRVLDVSDGGTGQQFTIAVDHEKTERRNEEMRLLYVATTRAAHRLVLWWAPAGETRNAAFTTLLVCRGEDGVVKGAATGCTSVPSDDHIVRHLDRLARLSEGRIGWHAVPDDPTPGTFVPEAVDPDDLDVARFTRDIDRAWYRTSYSRLTAPADVERTGGVAPAEAEPVGTDDEPEEAGVGGTAPAAGDAAGGAAATTDPALLAAANPLADLPGGTEFGTLVHTVLEHVDATSPDLESVVAAEVGRRLRRARLEVDPAVLTDGLVAALRTPLGPLLGGRALTDIHPSHLLPELEFELPLVGATPDGPDGRARLADVADLLADHLAPDDPLAHYPDVLRRAGFTRVLRGYLTGSIDLLVRVADDVPRYVVVDHKTNRLGTAPRTAADYTPAALAEAMVHGHYPLQALLYGVAAHRLLRWRQRGYDPDTHLGGVAYLFLRGMTGPDVPHVDGQPCGVFGWRPPTALVLALSDLLDSGRTDGRASA